MKQPITRRSFLKTSAATAAGAYAASALSMSARSYGNVVGANDDIRIAVIGFNSRGNTHIDAFREMKGVRLVALCDADDAVLGKGIERLSKAHDKPTTAPTSQPTAKLAGAKVAGKSDHREAEHKAPSTQPADSKGLKVQGFSDLRKLLDDKNIDAISTATPNHWHSLIGIWACQAGKDAYIEKPISHNVWEGRQLVDAARKYNRIVAAGTQSRSNSAVREAFEWVQAGHLGKINVARGFCYKRRASIGLATEPVKIPKSVNWDLWAGPASDKPPVREKLHYDWHWFWETGNGDLGNQGIHEMDKCRWASGKNHLSPKVLSVGGRFGYKDNGQTANTQFIIHDYGDMQIIFEVRGLWSKPGSGRMDSYKGQSVGQVIECDDGYLAGTVAYDRHGKEVKKFSDSEKDHFANFIKAVRSRKVEDLNADILEGHLSSALCHTGNISYRLGESAKPVEIMEQLQSNPEAMDTWSRFHNHLAANDISLVSDHAVLGAYLEMDPKTERFTNNDKANEMLKAQYRAPYVVPDKV